MRDERTALMLGMIDDPDDPAPRLVYADWLDENGEHERAAFVRLQVALTRTPASDPTFPALLQQEMDTAFRQERQFREKLPHHPGLTWGAFERGFVGTLTLEGQPGVASFAEHFAELTRATPWSELAVTQMNRDDGLTGWDRLPSAPCLRRVRFARSWGDRNLVPLFESELLTTARRLEFDFVNWDEATRAAFVTARHLGRLEELVLTGNGLLASRLNRLTAEKLPRLRHLAIRHSSLGREGTEALKKSGIVAELRSLDLNDAHLIGGEAVLPLVRIDFANLETLSLAENGFASVGYDILANATNFGALRSLDLRSTGATAKGLAALAGSPLARQLTRLDLSSNALDDAGVEALLSKPWPRLESLNLGRNALTDLAADALASSDALPVLRQLEIGGNEDLTENGVQAIVGSKYLGELRSLLAYGVKLSPKTRKAMAARFGS